MGIRNIKKGTSFRSQGTEYIALEDAHYNPEEECWIVYGAYPDEPNGYPLGFFEEDIDY